jgi:phosphatidylglycerol:prolipoprotein diacylglycerol transferase
MHPILGRYGPFFLYSYTVVMGLGLAAALGLTAFLAGRQGRQGDGWLDGVLLAAFAGLVGGRAGFVWANWAYFQDHAGEIPLVWQGGLSYHGVLLAGLAAFFLWTVWRKRPFGRDAALLAPGLALMTTAGWLACWLEGCGYGRETILGPLAADLPDSYGVQAVRYQTQMMGMALSLLAFFAVLALRRRLKAGALFWFALLALSLCQAAVSPASRCHAGAGFVAGRHRAEPGPGPGGPGWPGAGPVADQPTGGSFRPEKVSEA